MRSLIAKRRTRHTVPMCRIAFCDLSGTARANPHHPLRGSLLTRVEPRVTSPAARAALCAIRMRAGRSPFARTYALTHRKTPHTAHCADVQNCVLRPFRDSKSQPPPPATREPPPSKGAALSLISHARHNSFPLQRGKTFGHGMVIFGQDDAVSPSSKGTKGEGITSSIPRTGA